jgi:Spy/CpxP family protein refolding chaperone
MKNLKIHSCLIILLAFVAGVSGRPAVGKSPESFRSGTGRMPGLERLMANLTEEQRASLQSAMAAQREKIAGLEEKSREARRAMFESAMIEKFDEAAVRKQAMALSKIEAEMTVVRMKAFSEMRPQLSAEQMEKIRNFVGAAGPDAQPARKRNRPEIKRDENGLPAKDTSAK